jgi:hypothetical protein
MRANEAKTQVGRRREHELPPSLTNVRERIPPALAAPFSAQEDTGIVIGSVIVEENGSTVIEYVEEGIVVEDVDGWTMWSVCCPLGFTSLQFDKTWWQGGERTSGVGTLG